MGQGTLGETQKEETLVLARALQCCVEKFGVPSRVLCNAAWDLHSCMVPLMHLKASLLGATDNEPRAYPTPTEEVELLGNDPASQEALEITTCPFNHPGEAPKPKGAAGLEWTTADPQDSQEQIPLPPLGFGLPILMSGQPPLKDAQSLVRIPREAWLDLTSWLPLRWLWSEIA